MDSTSNSSAPRPFSLGLYLLIVFGFSWPFLIVSAIWANTFATSMILNGIAMVMVTVATYIAGRFVFRDGFAGAGWRWGNWKQHLIVIGLVALLFIFPTLVRAFTGRIAPGDVDNSKWILLAVLPLVILIPGFGEEFGWRGYMLPRIARRTSARKAVTIHAIIWWAWHLPAIIIPAVRSGIASAADTGIPVWLSALVVAITMLLASAIPAILHAVVFAYIWARSRSLAVATVYHAAYDGVRDSLSQILGLPAGVTMWSSLVISVLGIIFLWKGDWKNLTAPDPAPQPSWLAPQPSKD